MAVEVQEKDTPFFGVRRGVEGFPQAQERFLRIVARREQGPRLRDEPFPVPPQRPVQPYEIRIEIAQQVGREPRVQEHGPGPHKGLHKARPRRDARQKAVQKAVFAPGPFEKRPRQIHKEPQKKLSVARRNGQKMTPKADAAPMWAARRSGGILAAQRKTEKYRLRKKQASLLIGDGIRREPMPAKEACVSPCSGCNMSISFHPRHAKDSEWTSHSATSSNWP